MGRASGRSDFAACSGAHSRAISHAVSRALLVTTRLAAHATAILSQARLVAPHEPTLKRRSLTRLDTMLPPVNQPATRLSRSNIPPPPIKGTKIATLGQKRYDPEIIEKREVVITASNGEKFVYRLKEIETEGLTDGHEFIRVVLDISEIKGEEEIPVGYAHSRNIHYPMENERYTVMDYGFNDVLYPPHRLHESPDKF